MLDSGSQRAYITENLAEKLKLKKTCGQEIKLATFGTDSQKVIQTASTEICLRLNNGKYLNLSANIFYISQLIRFARVSSHVADFNARNKSLTAKLLQQGYRYHKVRKTFSKFYRRHYELVSKFNVGLKTLLHQGLSEPEFYGDLIYKFKKIVGRADFSDQFKKIIVRYKRIGYNINIMRQSACLVFNPITVNNFASLFNCTPVGRASDSMMAPT